LESEVLDLAAGLTMGYLPAAALDWATPPFPARALRPGESTVATVRMEADIQVPDGLLAAHTIRVQSNRTAQDGALQSSPEFIEEPRI